MVSCQTSASTQGVEADNGTRVSLSPLRPEFSNAVGDACRRAEQQEGGWLGDRPLVARARAAISRIAGTAPRRAVDDGRNRQERDGGDGTSRSPDHPGGVSCAHQTHQLFHGFLDSVRIAPGREWHITQPHGSMKPRRSSAVALRVQQRRNQRRLSRATRREVKSKNCRAEILAWKFATGRDLRGRLARPIVDRAPAARKQVVSVLLGGRTSSSGRAHSATKFARSTTSVRVRRDPEVSDGDSYTQRRTQNCAVTGAEGRRPLTYPCVRFRPLRRTSSVYEAVVDVTLRQLARVHLLEPLVDRTRSSARRLCGICASRIACRAVFVQGRTKTHPSSGQPSCKIGRKPNPR